jgi:hypothetical protein
VIPDMFTSRMSPVTGNVRIAIPIFNDHSIEARKYLIGIARLKCVPKGLKGDPFAGWPMNQSRCSTWSCHPFTKCRLSEIVITPTLKAERIERLVVLLVANPS